MLDLNDYGAISSELRLASDVKLLLDFILCVSSFGSTELGFFSCLPAARWKSLARTSHARYNPKGQEVYVQIISSETSRTKISLHYRRCHT
jgi:hypothetical protein